MFQNPGFESDAGKKLHNNVRASLPHRIGEIAFTNIDDGRVIQAVKNAGFSKYILQTAFHLHGMFFDVFRTGTRGASSEHTDTVMLCQGERAVLETTFRYPGDFMFHAHQSEFAELGWMGLFRAEARRDT